MRNGTYVGWLIKAILLCESSAEKCQGAAEVSAPARVIASGCISSGKHVNRIVISEKTLWYGIFHSWGKQSTSAATLVPTDASLIYKSREVEKTTSFPGAVPNRLWTR